MTHVSQERCSDFTVGIAPARPGFQIEPFSQAAGLGTGTVADQSGFVPASCPFKNSSAHFHLSEAHRQTCRNRKRKRPGDPPDGPGPSGDSDLSWLPWFQSSGERLGDAESIFKALLRLLVSIQPGLRFQRQTWTRSNRVDMQ